MEYRVLRPVKGVIKFLITSEITAKANRFIDPEDMRKSLLTSYIVYTNIQDFITYNNDARTFYQTVQYLREYS